MPVPAQLLTRILQLVAKLSRTAFKGNILLRKIDIKKIGKYAIEVERRAELGVDGAISQIVRISKSGKIQEVWHIVTKAGKIIHKHSKFKP